MSRTYRDSENEREQRRGWLMIIGFFAFLFIGCGLYWLYLSLNPQSVGGVKIASTSAPIDRMVQPESAPATQDLQSNVILPNPEPEIAEPEPETVTASAPVVEPEQPESEPVTLEPETAPVPEIETPVTEPEPVPAFEGPARVFEDPRWLQTASIRGVDDEGRGARFTVHLLSGANAWTFGKSTQMDVRGTVVPAADIFSADGVGEAYCDQSAVIALGAASFEGEETLNNRLASARGRTLVNAVKAAAPACDASPKRLVANLGEHTQSMVCPGNAERCPEVSAFQRPIVLIAARGDTASVDYGAALKNAIEAHETAGRQIFPRFKLGDYSQFDVAL